MEDLKEESGSQVFDAAIRQAEEALDLTSVSELSMALPAAYEALKAAVETYTEGLCAGWTPGEEVDLTWLLVNPDFSEGSKGWEGTSFTAASSGVAEFYDKTYDTYQVLERMPAGTYRLRVQGFYRYGDKAEAYDAHQDGSEQFLAGLYLNSSRQTFMSLFGRFRSLHYPTLYLSR